MTFASNSWPGQRLSGEQPSRLTQVLRRVVEPFARFVSPVQSTQVGAQDWGGAGASVTFTSPDLLAILERLYVLPGRERVLAFLEGRPHLVALLLEAYGEIHAYFQDVPLALRFLDGEDGIEQLGLSILVPADGPDEALERLASFDEGWWLDAMDRAQGELLITISAA